VTTTEAAATAFTVHLTNFSGPFDLLLQLISRHKLDITEVALSRVTDEFVAHLKHAQAAGIWELEETSQFIVVAATLLDLKAARLLPQGEVEDPEDLALLEARDLLFARLLQYRAFKQVSAWLGDVLAGEAHRHPRPGGLEERFAGLLPEVDLSGLADHLAHVAARALSPRVPPAARWQRRARRGRRRSPATTSCPGRSPARTSVSLPQPTGAIGTRSPPRRRVAVAAASVSSNAAASSAAAAAR